MPCFDVFNGDADGICALLQLRRAQPREAVLVTGVKREIRLLDRVQAGAGDRVTVLDISLNSNRDALARLLDSGARVEYFDHHDADPLPAHPLLETHIDQSPQICTSLLVDRHLQGCERRWALVGAYGDNLTARADALAAQSGVDAATAAQLRALGEVLNYNAYGEHEADLLIAPDALYRQLRPFDDPIAFVRDDPSFERLRSARAADLQQAQACAPLFESPRAVIYALPDAPWSRRVRGALSNLLNERSPQAAHAILTPDRRDGFVVSVRSPDGSARSASAFVQGFDSGGGRHRSAGINHLPATQLERFCAQFRAYYCDAG